MALFHNLLSNPTEPELAKENALAMVTCKVLKTLELLENRKFEVRIVVLSGLLPPFHI